MDIKKTTFWNIPRTVKEIAFVAILVALTIIFTRFVSIFANPLTRVDPAGVAVIMIAGILFGPVSGALVGGLSDILGFLIYNPTAKPWNPAIFVAQIAYGFLAGAIYWLLIRPQEGQKNNAWQIIVSVVIARIVGFFITTYGLYMIYTDKTFLAILMARVVFEPLFIVWYSVIVIAIVGVFVKTNGGAK